MIRANPSLPRNIRGRTPKVPEHVLRQYVKGTPRLGSEERHGLEKQQLRTHYVPRVLDDKIKELRNGGAAISHTDEDVRFFLHNYNAGRDMGREMLEKYYRGYIKVAKESGVRLKPGLNPSPSHKEQDIKRSGKRITAEGLKQEEQKQLSKAADLVHRKQIRAQFRDPERRGMIRGDAPALGSSIIQKEEPAGFGSIFDYKPGSAPGETPNPANAGSPNPAGLVNPANPSPGALPPLVGMHGLSRSAGHELPDQPGGLSHAPDASYPAAPLAPSSRVSNAPPSAPSSPAPEPPVEPSEEAPSEPQDMAIG